MNTSFIRKIHYWITPFIVLPLLVILSTGLLLMFKKQSDWVQPPTKYGTGTSPEISFSSMLDTLQSHAELMVVGWKSIDRIDVRPNKGMAKIRLKSGIEVQIDTQTGEVLQIARRRSDIIENIHTGELGGNWVKYGIFLPVGGGLILMLITGLILFFATLPTRWKQLKKSILS